MEEKNLKSMQQEQSGQQEKSRIDEEQTRLLETMIKRQERDIVINRVTAFAECTLLVILVIVFALLVPRFLKTVRRVDEGMEEVSAFLSEAEVTVEKINHLAGEAEEAMSEAVELADNANTVIEDNDEALSEAIENFNKLDFESLNNSILRLEEIITPVADLASRILS